MKKIILLLTLSLFPVIALAHGNKVAVVSSSVAKALEFFQDSESGKIQKSFVGVKAWVDGTDINVKILMNENKVFVYACEITTWEHSGGKDVPVADCKKTDTANDNSNIPRAGGAEGSSENETEGQDHGSHDH